MRFATIVAAALALLAASAGPAAAQSASGNETAAAQTAPANETLAVTPWAEERTQDATAQAGAAQTTDATQAAGVQAPAAASGLQRATPPRTLRAYWHVFIAFAVAWVLLFGYVVTLAQRFKRLEEQVGVGR